MLWFYIFASNFLLCIKRLEWFLTHKSRLTIKKSSLFVATKYELFLTLQQKVLLWPCLKANGLFKFYCLGRSSLHMVLLSPTTSSCYQLLVVVGHLCIAFSQPLWGFKNTKQKSSDTKKVPKPRHVNDGGFSSCVLVIRYVHMYNNMYYYVLLYVLI